MNPQSSPMADTQNHWVDLSASGQKIGLFFRRNLWWFVLVTLSAIGLGYLKYQTDDKIYASKMTAETFTLGDSRISDLIEPLSLHIKYGDHDQLAKLLGMSVADAQKIVSLTAGTNYELEKKVKGSQMYVDDLPKQVFFVEASVKDTAILGKLQQGLVSYITNNPVSKIRIKALHESLSKYITDVDRQIRRSDSLTDLLVKHYMTHPSAGLTINFGTAIEGTGAALEDRIEVAKQYASANEVNVIVPFPKYGKPESPRLLISLLLFVLPANLLLLVGLLVAKR